ncbi:MAG: hypothetical protein R2881_08435 [Eubacteriales bacterium]
MVRDILRKRSFAHFRARIYAGSAKAGGALRRLSCLRAHLLERAISDNGYDYAACARAYMGGDPMEDWVMDSMTCILGCELCQRVCPYNFIIGYAEDVPDAFRLEEILSGKIKPVLEIVGKISIKKDV